MDKLEKEMRQLHQQQIDLVANCYASIHNVLLRQQGWDESKALEEAKNIGNDFLKHYGL